jgi:lipopolysaccharide biosynthesis glycosyltransferase
MRLVTAIDEAYLPGLIALHNSIKANSPGTPLACMVYGDEGLCSRVESRGIDVIRNPIIDAELPVTKLWPVGNPAMYARLLIPKYYHSPVAWIDADCIVLRPLDELETIKFDQPVAAVRTSTTTLGQQVDGLKFCHDTHALFAGLLIYNTHSWWDMDVTYKCMEAMKENLDFKYAVQSVLSYILMGNFHELPYKWQVFANREETDKTMIDMAMILHYVGDLPWKNKMRNQEIWERYSKP